MNSHERDWRHDASTDHIEQILLADLSDLHQVEVPHITFAPPVRRTGNQGGFLSRNWRTSLVAAALAGLALVVAASAAWPGNDTQGVSAEEILDRASAAAATFARELPPYHLLTESTFDQEGGTGTYLTETWYASATTFRTEQRLGARLEIGQARNGNDVWLYLTGAAGTLRAVHASGSEDVIGISLGVFPESAGLTELLSAYNQPCMRAQVVDETVYLSRPAYVIRVDYDAASCPKGAIKEHDRKAVTMMTIDKELFLPLVTERLEDNGKVGYRYVVKELDLNPPFTPDTFSFQPPPGVDLIEVRSMQEAKMALAEMAPLKPLSDDCRAVVDEGVRDGVKTIECPANAP